MKHSETTDNDNKIKRNEDPFSLIEKGNSLESSRNQWGSSNFYSRAFTALLHEYNSSDLCKTTSSSNSTSKAPDKDQQKIAALYHDQSVEYLNRARKSLISALMFEQEEDLRRWADILPMVDVINNVSSEEQLQTEAFDPLMVMLTDEEKQRRAQTFHTLFISPSKGIAEKDTKVPKECEVVLQSKNNNDDSTKCERLTEKNHEILENKEEKSNAENESFKDGDEVTGEDVNSNDESELTSLEVRLSNLVPASKALKTVSSESNKIGNNAVELSLEQRLANLDSSLPKIAAMKSNDERLENIKSGLGDLGVYVPSENKECILDGKILCEDEQVQLIMNIVKDEVALDKRSADDDTSDVAVEDILKRSGIRIELPLEDDSDEVFEFANPDKDEIIFPMKDLKLSEKDDEISNGEVENVEDLKRVLTKSQQMLLQVSICLDECEDFKILSCSKETRTTLHNDDVFTDANDNNGLEEEAKEMANNLDHKDYKENYSSSFTKDKKFESDGEDVENGYAQDEMNGNKPMWSSQDTEEERLRKVGKESLLKAQAYLERLIKAWPSEDTSSIKSTL